LKWDWVMKASKLDLTPPKYEFGDLPVVPVATTAIATTAIGKAGGEKRGYIG